MRNDPIVAEVHRIRDELSAAFNFDVAAIFADLRQRQSGLGSRLVSPNRGDEAALGPDPSRKDRFALPPAEKA